MENELNIGNALSAEFPEGTSFAPPQSQEEFQQRRAGWNSVLEEIRNDPQLRGMILRAGLRMMQPRPAWQTTGGHIASALEDSLAWLGAQQELQRKAGLEERRMKLDETKGQASVEHTQAQTDATQQATAQNAATFPTKLGIDEAKLQALQAEEKKLRAMEAAGMFTPEYYQLQQQLEADKAKAYTDMLRAHAEAYLAPSKASATPKTDVIELPDNTKAVITTRLVNGQPYYSMMVPPQVTDPARAQQIVDAEVKKAVGYGWGKPDFYPLTEAEYRAKRLKELTEPRGYHLDSSFRQIPSIPEEAPAAPLPAQAIRNKWDVLAQRESEFDPLFASAESKYGLPAGVLKRLAITESSLNPRAKNTKDGGQGSFGLMQVNSVHFPGAGVDANSVLDPATNIDIGARILADNLRKTDGDLQKALQLYKGATSDKGKSDTQGSIAFIAGAVQKPAQAGVQAAAPQPAAGGRKVIKVEGEPGNLRIAGEPAAISNTEYRPGLLQQAREYVQTSVTENKKAQARTRLAEVRAKQRLGLPLTDRDREVLALLGESE